MTLAMSLELKPNVKLHFKCLVTRDGICYLDVGGPVIPPQYLLGVVSEMVVI